jgi:RNA-directed DNA polymerase
MKDAIEKALLVQCRKSIDAANLSCYIRQKKRQEYQKVTGDKAAKVSGRMTIWKLGHQFHPYYVRNHVDSYSRSLANSIAAGKYSPKPCLNIEIPKDGGKKRTISQYTVVDSALSCWLYASLLDKNVDRLSKFAFAFRRDRNATDAIEMLSKRISKRSRTFCVEIDFKNCFDAISHKYLLEVLDKHFDIPAMERQLIIAFLKGSYARGLEQYEKGNFKPRLSGIPQGSTISLFLANAVFVELDRALESAWRNIRSLRR